jgi:hypothetical protein
MSLYRSGISPPFAVASFILSLNPLICLLSVTSFCLRLPRLRLAMTGGGRVAKASQVMFPVYYVLDGVSIV